MNKETTTEEDAFSSVERFVDECPHMDDPQTTSLSQFNRAFKAWDRDQRDHEEDLP